MVLPGAEALVVEEGWQGCFVGCGVRTRFGDYGQRSGSESATRRCVDGRQRAQDGVARVAGRGGCCSSQVQWLLFRSRTDT